MVVALAINPRAVDRARERSNTPYKPDRTARRTTDASAEARTEEWLCTDTATRR